MERLNWALLGTPEWRTRSISTLGGPGAQSNPSGASDGPPSMSLFVVGLSACLSPLPLASSSDSQPGCSLFSDDGRDMPPNLQVEPRAAGDMLLSWA